MASKVEYPPNDAKMGGVLRTRTLSSSFPDRVPSPRLRPIPGAVAVAEGRPRKADCRVVAVRKVREEGTWWERKG